MREIAISKKYKLREDGKVFDIETGEEITLKPGNWTGYRIRCFDKTYYVHYLVLLNFGPPKPGDNYVVGHLNKNAYDNRLENLKWMTRSEIGQMRIDALPVGQRRSDYETEAEYLCENAKRYRAKNKDRINFANREKNKIRARQDYQDEEKRQRHKESCKRYYEKNKEKIKEYHKKYNKEWYEKNKKNRVRDSVKDAEANKKWRENNKEKFKEIQRKYSEAHRAELNAYNKKWREEHPYKVKERKQKEKEWYKNNPDWKKENYQKRMSDPTYREKLYLQNRIRRKKYRTDPEFCKREAEYRRNYRKNKKTQGDS